MPKPTKAVKAVKKSGKKASKKAPTKARRGALAGVGKKSRIITHDEPTPTSAEFPPAQLSAKAMDAVEKHVSKHVGRFDDVLHEIMSMGIHLDVLPVPPSKKHPFHTYVTMGMSALPMTLPKGHDGPRRAELCVVLPPEWKTDERSMNQAGGRWFWPIQGLKELARLPSSFDSFLDYGHTVPNGDPPAPFGVKCPFVCWMVIPPVCFTRGFETLKGKPHATRFMQIIPLHRDEMEFKLAEGTEALWDLFSASDLDPALACDPARPSVCSLLKPVKPARARGSRG